MACSLEGPQQPLDEGPVGRPCLQPPSPAPRQRAEHQLHSHVVPLQVGDSVLSVTRARVGSGNHPKQSPAFLSATLWAFFSGWSCPLNKGRAGPPSTLAFVNAEPTSRGAKVDKGWHGDGRRQGHCLADRLAGCKYWPLIVLASFFGLVWAVFLFFFFN